MAMNANDFSDFRARAWGRLMKEGWLLRMIGGSILLGICGRAVQTVVGGMLGRLNVPSWSSYLEALALNSKTLTTPVPNLTEEYIRQATSGSLLELFFGMIMGGIAAYGAGVILSRCLKNDDKNWLKAAFGGFRMPFGLFGLLAYYWAIWLGWWLLALLPPAIAGYFAWNSLGAAEPGVGLLAAWSAGFALASGLAIALLCVPFYRYRFLYLVKAENPDLSAIECIRRCRHLTDGHKWESFKLDCSFWRQILLLIVVPPVLAVLCFALDRFFPSAGVVRALSLTFCILMSMAFVAMVFVLGLYIQVAQGFFYDTIRSVSDASAAPVDPQPPAAAPAEDTKDIL